VPAAPIAGSDGLEFGRDGALYVGSIENREIVKMDPRTGAILATFRPDRGFEGADGLALGPDGAIYYTAPISGEVGEIKPDGTHATVAKLPAGVNGIAVSDDGRLFVGLAFEGDALYEVDPHGVTPPRLITTGLGLNDLIWSNGNLYGVRMFTGELARIDTRTGAATTVAAGLGFPDSVDVDSRGRFYVSDLRTGRIFRIEPGTGSTQLLATLGGNKDSIAIDAHDAIFISDDTDGSIVQLRGDGRTRPVSPGGLGGPDGLAVLPADHGETVYAADLFRLYGFDGRTGRTRSVVEAGPARTAGFHTPFTVGADGSALVLTSWLLGAVTTLDPQSQAVTASCFDPGLPLDALGYGGQVVVSDLTAHQVSELDMSTCTRTALATASVPTGLATDGTDLWAADWADGTVTQIAHAGHAVAPRRVATGLAGPEGLAVAPGGGALLVVETAEHRVSRIDLATGAVTPLIDGLDVGRPGPSVAPPIWIFDGIAVGPSGEVYVSAHGLYRFRIRP
jgi:sugar lactone lactonase YvrE